jgi:hypothetical protein
MGFFGHAAVACRSRRYVDDAAALTATLRRHQAGSFAGAKEITEHIGAKYVGQMRAICVQNGVGFTHNTGVVDQSIEPANPGSTVAGLKVASTPMKSSTWPRFS